MAVAAGVAVLGSLCFPLARIAATDLPPLALAGSRLLIASAGLAVISAVTRRPLPSARLCGHLATTVGPLLAVAFASMFVAAPRLDPGLATVLENTQPLIAAAIAVPVLGERLGRVRAWAMGIAFCGVGLVALDAGTGRAVDPAGVGVVLLAAASLAVANVLQRRIAARVDPLVGSSIALASGGLALTVASMATESANWRDVSTTSVVALLVLALAGTALTQTAWLWVLRRLELAVAGQMLFLAPVVALLIGVIWFGERPALLSMVGSALILASGVISAIGAPLAHTESEKPERTP